MNDVFIPAYTTTLVGRARETAEVVALVRDPAIPLVTLTGTSGTGKTRLSIEVFQALTDLGQQVVFVPLAAVTKPEFVLPAIAHQLGVRESGSLDLIDLLIDHLDVHPLMLVLDNFEQVLPAAVDLDRLLQALPNLTVVVTSQEPLQLPSETLYMIPGLDVPDTVVETAEAALQCAAVQLFVQRIQVVRPTFVLDETNVQPVVEICQMLEGLPLAIEIVATHSEVLLPHDLCLLVKQHLRLYRFRAKGATGRQRIILPMIEWSLLRLPEPAQELFSYLGVFQGGWMFDALEAVGQYFDDLYTPLNILVERHLVLKQTTEDVKTRYMMLDAVQDFANTRFNQLDAAKRELSINQHLRFIYDLAYQSHYDLKKGREQGTWVSRLNQEMPNIRFLLEYSIVSDPLAAINLAEYLDWFWYLGGYWKEGVYWYEQLLQFSEISPAQYGRLAKNCGTLLSALSSFDEAQAIGEAGIKAAQQAGDRKSEAYLCNMLGLLFVDTLRYEPAKMYLEQAVAAGKDVEDWGLITGALVNLAIIDSRNRAYSVALARYQDAHQIAVAQDQKVVAVVALCNIGSTYIALKQPEKAIDPLNEVLEVAQNLQFKELYGAALYMKAEALLFSGRSGSVPLLQESISTLTNLGSQLYLCHALDVTALLFELNKKIDVFGCLVGAVDSLRSVIQVPRNPEQSDSSVMFDLLLERASANPAFQAARHQGQAWSREQVVEYALRELAVFEAQ